MDSFDKVYRRGQPGVKSALQTVQGRLKVVNSVASGIVMLLIKASVEVCCRPHANPYSLPYHLLFSVILTLFTLTLAPILALPKLINRETTVEESP